MKAPCVIVFIRILMCELISGNINWDSGNIFVSAILKALCILFACAYLRYIYVQYEFIGFNDSIVDFISLL